MYGGDPLDGGRRQSRNIFMLSSGLQFTTHPSSALSSCSMTISARGCHLFLVSSDHLETFSHQVDDPSASVILLFFVFNVYSFLRQRETEHERGGSERGRHRIWNRLQALSCQHKAQRGARTHRLWDHDLSRSQMLNRPSHPGAPLQCI